MKIEVIKELWWITQDCTQICVGEKSDDATLKQEAVTKGEYKMLKVSKNNGNIIFYKDGGSISDEFGLSLNEIQNFVYGEK